MTKFTEGEWLVVDKDEPSKPWHSQKVNNTVKMPSSQKTKYGACIYSCIGGFDIDTQKDEVEANAHLIASAPSMYAMLEEVLAMQKQWYGYGMETHIKLSDMADKMEALLKSARGEL